MTIQRVRDWMTPEPIVAGPEMTLEAAYQLTEEHDIRHLPVVALGRLLGIVTRDEIRRLQLTAAAEYAYSELATWAVHLKTVGELTLLPPVTIQPDMEMWQAAKLLLWHKLTALPVVAEGRLVGILTESDVFRMVMTEWRADAV